MPSMLGKYHQFTWSGRFYVHSFIETFFAGLILSFLTLTSLKHVQINCIFDKVQRYQTNKVLLKKNAAKQLQTLSLLLGYKRNPITQSTSSDRNSPYIWWKYRKVKRECFKRKCWHTFIKNLGCSVLLICCVSWNPSQTREINKFFGLSWSPNYTSNFISINVQPKI